MVSMTMSSEGSVLVPTLSLPTLPLSVLQVLDGRLAPSCLIDDHSSNKKENIC